jgi:hypothetical protein
MKFDVMPEELSCLANRSETVIVPEPSNSSVRFRITISGTMEEMTECCIGERIPVS